MILFIYDDIHQEQGACGRYKEKQQVKSMMLFTFDDFHSEKHVPAAAIKSKTCQQFDLCFQLFLNSVSLSMWAQIGAPAVNGHMLCLGMWLYMYIYIDIYIYMY